MNLTNAELTVLGLIIEKPRHGYELEQVIQERGVRQWTELGFSSIYYVLDKLKTWQLVSTEKLRGQRNKQIFTATRLGYNAATEATEAALRDPSPTYPDVLVGLANLPLLDAAQISHAFACRDVQLKERLQTILAKRAAQQPLPDFVEAIFSYSLSLLEAERKWLTRVSHLGNQMGKVDFKKELDSYQAKYNEFRIVDIPKLQYVMVDGHGDPNTAPEYVDAIVALYPVAYKLKFASKLDLGKDYVVMPLEGLWWSDDMDTFTSARDKSQWDWTMMIMQPDWVTQEMFEAAIRKVSEKDAPKSLGKLRLETLDEGRSVQTLHIGSFDDEAAILAKMHHQFIPSNKFKMVKKHHEIYLSDSRKVTPEKLRTILRQPVEAE